MSKLAKIATKTPIGKKNRSSSPTCTTPPPRSIHPAIDHILALQRTIGNQAVQRLLKTGVIQAKLRIGQPGDIYEQEADRLAEQVMKMAEPPVQRQPQKQEERKEEEELLYTKPVAEQISPLLQRQVDEEEKEEEQELQMKASPGPAPEVAPDLESRINAMKGGGQPLPASTRAFFEPRFDQDFSNVRVHADSWAAQTAKAVQAKAFTVGNDVVFGAGQYAPESNQGRQLLAHELAHTIQQNSDRRKNAQLRANKTNDQIVQRQTPSATGGLPVWNEEEKKIIHQSFPGEFGCLYRGLFRGQGIDQKYFIVHWMKGAVGIEYYTCNYAKKYNHQDQPEVDYNFPEWEIDVPSKSNAEFVGLTKRPHIIGFKDKPRVGQSEKMARRYRWPSGAVWKAYMQFRIQVYRRETLQGLAVTDFKSIDDPRPAMVVPWSWDDEYEVP